jgi:hypothetical protein
MIARYSLRITTKPVWHGGEYNGWWSTEREHKYVKSVKGEYVKVPQDWPELYIKFDHFQQMIKEML